MDGRTPFDDERATESIGADLGRKLVFFEEPGAFANRVERAGDRRESPCGPRVVGEFDVSRSCPVAVDAVLVDELTEALESRNRLFPKCPAVRRHEGRGEVGLQSWQDHAAVATARAPRRVVAVEHDDGTPTPRGFVGDGQSRVTGADDDDVRVAGRAVGCRGGEFDPVPPERLTRVSRRERGGAANPITSSAFS